MAIPQPEAMNASAVATRARYLACANLQSLRGQADRHEGRATLAQAYADVRDMEVWLIGAEIAVYEQGNSQNHHPTRDRKLLLRKAEISSLVGKVKERGLTLVPTRLYFKDGKVKLELAVARGKEKSDKRRTIADRDAKRQIDRALKSRR
jgi:SsrA-binding protein